MARSHGSNHGLCCSVPAHAGAVEDAGTVSAENGSVMHIDWNAFTPGSALAGGVLIGVAAVMFALLVGRIAGISGIVGGLLRPARGDIAWRLAFIGGLVA